MSFAENLKQVRKEKKSFTRGTGRDIRCQQTGRIQMGAGYGIPGS